MSMPPSHSSVAIRLGYSSLPPNIREASSATGCVCFAPHFHACRQSNTNMMLSTLSRDVCGIATSVRVQEDCNMPSYSPTTKFIFFQTSLLFFRGCLTRNRQTHTDTHTYTHTHTKRSSTNNTISPQS